MQCVNIRFTNPTPNLNNMGLDDGDDDDDDDNKIESLYSRTTGIIVINMTECYLLFHLTIAAWKLVE